MTRAYTNWRRYLKHLAKWVLFCFAMQVMALIVLVVVVK